MNILKNILLGKKFLFCSTALVYICFSVLKSAAVSEPDFKTLPYTTIGHFEKEYVQSKKKASSYEFVETVEFTLSDENPMQMYSGTNEDLGMAFSFVETNDGVVCSVILSDAEPAVGNSQVGFGGGPGRSTEGNTAVYVKMDPKITYQFKYSRGFKDDGSLYKSKEPIESVSGKINIYKILKKDKRIKL
jgi:hypothetical protein